MKRKKDSIEELPRPKIGFVVFGRMNGESESRPDYMRNEGPDKQGVAAAQVIQMHCEQVRKSVREKAYPRIRTGNQVSGCYSLRRFCQNFGY